MSAPILTPAQTHALFDILIHQQLYAEIEAFKYPDAIQTYGYPFRKEDGMQTTSPLLQNIFNKLALRLPGLKDVGREFWQDKVAVLVKKLAEAELSESYDKGAIGARKALATAISSMLEYVARGMLGGLPKREQGKVKGVNEKEYDTWKAEDISRAWDDAIHEVIYGDLLDEAFKKTGETGKLEDHSSLVQAAHEYILLNLASLLHHIFVMSPDGQYILRVLENVHRLVPYYGIKQTLKVGNAATMINGMVKLVLTKISVTAVTNWIGLTNNANDGMNLMQQIISTVMAWDTSEFQKRAQKLESQRDAPDKKVFKAIRDYVYASRDTHEAGRNISIQESKSIICVILETANPPLDPDELLTDHQHAIAQEHYSTLMSIRDREELTKILCKMQPDLLTSSIRDLVAAFDPIIRGVHNTVDLSATIADAESFLTDLIAISKPKRPNGHKGSSASRAASRANSRSSSPAPAPIPTNAPASVTDKEAPGTQHASIPTVEDYVHLLRKHMPSAHKYLHQICKNAPDLANQYLEYAKASIAEFKMHDAPPTGVEGEGTADNADNEHGDGGGAGNMTAPLHSLFSSLPKEKQDELKPLLDHHAKHLKQLQQTSHSRLKALITSTSKPNTTPDHDSAKHAAHATMTTHGPGIFLSRWHALLDSTLITPSSLHGPVRRGFEVKGELDGKGLKTDTVLLHSKTFEGKAKRRGSNASLGVANLADGTGDAKERTERKREGKEEERMKAVWRGMGDGWVGVCRGLEVMGE